MGETVDALVVGTPLFLPMKSCLPQWFLFKLGIMGQESVGEVYRLLYARYLMIGTPRRQTKSQSARSLFCFANLSILICPKVQHLCPHRIRP